MIYFELNFNHILLTLLNLFTASFFSPMPSLVLFIALLKRSIDWSDLPCHLAVNNGHLHPNILYPLRGQFYGVSA